MRFQSLITWSGSRCVIKNLIGAYPDYDPADFVGAAKTTYGHIDMYLDPEFYQAEADAKVAWAFCVPLWLFKSNYEGFE